MPAHPHPHPTPPPRRAGPSPLAPIILGSLFAALILATMVVPAALAIREYQQARQWVPTDATVTDSYSTATRTGHTRRFPATCRVTYRYVAAGRTYTSDQIGFDDLSVDGNIQYRCLTFRDAPVPRPGDVIPIIYDPRRPDRAAFLPTFPRGARQDLIRGALILCFIGALTALIVRFNAD